MQIKNILMRIGFLLLIFVLFGCITMYMPATVKRACDTPTLLDNQIAILIPNIGIRIVSVDGVNISKFCGGRLEDEHYDYIELLPGTHIIEAALFLEPYAGGTGYMSIGSRRRIFEGKPGCIYIAFCTQLTLPKHSGGGRSWDYQIGDISDLRNKLGPNKKIVLRSPDVSKKISKRISKSPVKLVSKNID